MTLIKIDDRYINLDQVTDVIVDDDALILTLTAITTRSDDDTVPESQVVCIEGHEAIALRSWLDGRASDVLRLYELEQAARNG